MCVDTGDVCVVFSDLSRKSKIMQCGASKINILVYSLVYSNVPVQEINIYGMGAACL